MTTKLLIVIAILYLLGACQANHYRKLFFKHNPEHQMALWLEEDAVVVLAKLKWALFWPWNTLLAMWEDFRRKP